MKTKAKRWNYAIVLRKGKRVVTYAIKRGWSKAIEERDMIEQKENLRKGTLDIIKNFV